MRFRVANLDWSPGQRPLVMGILNVTPDSFSDGGQFLDPNAAIRRARDMIRQGADIIDVGAESTRPGSDPVADPLQIDRAIPVIEGIRESGETTAMSIDTTSADVARAAIRAGADIVNDVSALRADDRMATLVAETRCGVVLMHMRGSPGTMQQDGGPQYDDVVGEVSDFIRERLACAKAAGIDPHAIAVDPGFGFGKRTEHNLALLAGLNRLVDIGPPILVGVSRKSFIGKTLGIDAPADRDPASLACAVLAARTGAAVIRTHAVRATAEALKMVHAAYNPPA